ncbi:hypothetical protein WJX72_012311 [[Myrmecia] bisecta]|uniref:Uncharacterized protein n=1 Tax=[Myrmecia] bisecta TaxID=41462 RepID=A0AAW1PMP2_9CHLO
MGEDKARKTQKGKQIQPSSTGRHANSR